jgi:hypothetical protein
MTYIILKTNFAVHNVTEDVSILQQHIMVASLIKSKVLQVMQLVHLSHAACI